MPFERSDAARSTDSCPTFRARRRRPGRARSVRRRRRSLDDRRPRSARRSTSTAPRRSATRYRALDAAFGGVSARPALRAEGQLDAGHRPAAARARAAAPTRTPVGEIDVALRAGLHPAQNRVHRRRQVARRARRGPCRSASRRSTRSRPGELRAHRRHRARRAGRARASRLRVNPDIDAQSHPHISTGLQDQQVRRAARRGARPLSRRRRDAPGCELVGVHVHVGSQITTLEPLARAAAARRRRSRASCAPTGIALEHVDLGGGLGISYDGAPVPTPRTTPRRIVDGVAADGPAARARARARARRRRPACCWRASST